MDLLYTVKKSYIESAYNAAGWDSAKAFAKACGIDEGDFCNILIGKRSLGRVEKPEKLSSIAVQLAIGNNGKRYLTKTKQLIIFLSNFSATIDGKKWIMQEVKDETRRLDIPWDEEDATSKVDHFFNQWVSLHEQAIKLLQEHDDLVKMYHDLIVLRLQQYLRDFDPGSGWV